MLRHGDEIDCFRARAWILDHDREGRRAGQPADCANIGDAVPPGRKHEVRPGRGKAAAGAPDTVLRIRRPPWREQGPLSPRRHVLEGNCDAERLSHPQHLHIHADLAVRDQPSGAPGERPRGQPERLRGRARVRCAGFGGPHLTAAEISGKKASISFRFLSLEDVKLRNDCKSVTSDCRLLARSRPFVQGAATMRSARLDATDWRILRELQADGRITRSSSRAGSASPRRPACAACGRWRKPASSAAIRRG